MHTEQISRVTAEATDKVLDGTITPEAAKAVSDLARTEISNWRVRLEYARHTGKVVTIAELETTVRIRKAAA